jgi:D-3-phosphoglycerate dehydrogenase|tara:strand:+ start:408 stop:1370 length:963 start_codon:yes stop_codon:yes gene_type:complete
MYKIGIIDKMKDKGIDLLKSYKDFDCEIITDLSRKNLLSKLPQFDGITLRRGKIDREILNNCSKLKVIARHGVGYDSVDTICLKEKNITLLVAHNSTSTSPAEHIMFMIMNIYKGVGKFDEMVRKGDFLKAIHLNIEENFELFNKTVFIVGFGRIGKKLIKKCQGFDMNVIVFDPYIDTSIVTALGGKKVSTLEEGLKKADILSLSLPLNKETKNLITLKEMKIMKKSSIIINAARGGIINEIDLDNALNNKIISFAGIDVFEKEPPEETNPLLVNKRVVLSPHAATFTKEGLENMAIETAQNIIDFFENKIENNKIVRL